MNINAGKNPPSTTKELRPKEEKPIGPPSLPLGEKKGLTKERKKKRGEASPKDKTGV